MRNECVMIGCFNSGINTTDFPIPMEPEKSGGAASDAVTMCVHHCHNNAGIKLRFRKVDAEIFTNKSLKKEIKISP